METEEMENGNKGGKVSRFAFVVCNPLIFGDVRTLKPGINNVAFPLDSLYKTVRQVQTDWLNITRYYFSCILAKISSPCEEIGRIYTRLSTPLAG